ncbi:NAD(P)H-binding protein [Planctobacterium marinum]|uniref:Oxidoreductase n=1 Tax=Planctobacterium marinum TaxID=1631968 RepID=A0AA48HVT4_9ALTE|nr:oxidoreductase [Planctobacterium marinum]
MRAQNHKTALLLGATGLVGQHLLTLLLDDPGYDRIICLVRSKPESGYATMSSAGKLQLEIVDYENLTACRSFFGASHIYVCLGTTIKKAGSEQAFRRVDYDYVLQAAQLAKAEHAQSFVWISSVGADASSSNFYLRVKGELEDAIANITELHAKPVQPSLLLGERDEFRLGERMGVWLSPLLSPLMQGPLRKYRPVHVIDVARQMMALQQWD